MNLTSSMISEKPGAVGIPAPRQHSYRWPALYFLETYLLSLFFPSFPFLICAFLSQCNVLRVGYVCRTFPNLPFFNILYFDFGYFSLSNAIVLKKVKNDPTLKSGILVVALTSSVQ